MAPSRRGGTRRRRPARRQRVFTLAHAHCPRHRYRSRTTTTDRHPRPPRCPHDHGHRATPEPRPPPTSTGLPPPELPPWHPRPPHLLPQGPSTLLPERRALWARMGPSRSEQDRGKPPAAAGHAAATSPFLEPGPGHHRHPWQQQDLEAPLPTPRSAQRRRASSHRAPPSGPASNRSSKHPKHQVGGGGQPPLLHGQPNQPT